MSLRKSRRFFSLLAHSLIICGLLAASVSVGGLACADEEDRPISWQQDAELTDVFFIDSNRGWTVGAQGVILRTMDGGKSWSRSGFGSGVTPDALTLSQKLRNLKQLDEIPQFKPPRFRLASVCFVDAQNGWAAGGYEIPYVGRSYGVVLRTTDGGAHWRRVQGLVIPRISQIHFRDQQNGWAVGDSSNLYQSGIYYTSDGGNTWTSLSSAAMPEWQSVSKVSGGFVAVDAGGTISRINNNRLEPSVVLDRNAGRINEVEMIDNENGWAVGDRGTVLRTADGGKSWNRATLVGNQAWQHFDLNSISSTLDGQIVWMAGNPGTTIFGVDLKTGQVIAKPTGTTAPIKKIEFADENRGTAVGALGQILVSENGGKDWMSRKLANERGNQNSESSRVGLMAISRHACDLPLEMMARYACEENVLTATVTLESSLESDEVRQACERLGGSIHLSMNANSKSDDVQARNDLLRRLVRTIRTIRPSVVAANFSSQATNGSLQDESLLMEAIELAATRTGYPDQLEMTGLETWRVERVAVSDRNGRTKLDAGRLLPRTGVLLEDKIAISRCLLGRSVVAMAPAAFRVEHPFASGGSFSADELFDNLLQVPVRHSRERGSGNLASMQKMSKKRKQLNELMSWSISTPADMQKWKKTVSNWVMGIEPTVAGAWLAELSQMYLDAGQDDLAVATMDLLSGQLADHPLAPAAMTWLVQYYASDEYGGLSVERDLALAKMGQGRIGDDPNEMTVQQIRHNGMNHMVIVPNRDLQQNIEQVDAIEVTPEMLATARLKLASQYLQRIRQRDPDLALGPNYRFLEAQIVRKSSGALAAENLLSQILKRRSAGDSLLKASGREMAIGKANLKDQSATIAPEVDWVCLPTSERPQLDGKLNEAMWAQAMRVSGSVQRRVKSPTDGAGQEDLILMSHDDRFIYFAGRLQKVRGQLYGSPAKRRTRDPDLSNQDRVKIRIDVDRDYCSSYDLSIDHRGWCSDACGNCSRWNPDWYVASLDSGKAWTFEVAIPKEAISVNSESKPVWAVGFSRIDNFGKAVWENQPSPDGAGFARNLKPQVDEFGLMLLK